MKILVTGGAGFIGAYTAKALISRGDEVIIIDDFNDYYSQELKRNRIATLLKDSPIKIYESDICDFTKLEKIFSENKIEKICHLAARAGVRASIDDPFIYQKTNIEGTLNLLELARRNKIQNFVFASSSSVYGNNSKIPFSEEDFVDKPISPYAATKKTCELLGYTYHHLYGLNVMGLRFFTVYGPWGRPDMAYFKFAEAIKNNKPISLFNYGIDLKRDFTYIADIVEGILSALDKNLAYEIINLGNNSPVDLARFVEIIEQNFGKMAEKQYLPMQQGDVMITYANIDKAKKLLGYKPQTSIEDGLYMFIKWFKEYFN
ncbi:MAG: NAD-dependent epimerase/dehydratase [Parcubacteria group bacterium GW2011_GWA2_40_23]|nr:MAG: NAD-dependent epimerase/dehydratase [Parcubacteria group bacterium GW2011_GWA2_40_23]